MNNQYRTNRHSCFQLTYHLVVVTKYRNKVINQDILNTLKDIAKNIFETSYSCTIIEINGEADHLHILFEAPPQVQLSKLVNSFKTVSSRLIRKNFAVHLAPFYWRPYFWSQSYLILSTGGAPIDIIKKYIEEQSTPRE